MDICANCEKEILPHTKHVKAPENDRGIKCLILVDFAKYFDQPKSYFGGTYDPYYDLIIS